MEKVLKTYGICIGQHFLSPLKELNVDKLDDIHANSKMLSLFPTINDKFSLT